MTLPDELARCDSAAHPAVQRRCSEILERAARCANSSCDASYCVPRLVRCVRVFPCLRVRDLVLYLSVQPSFFIRPVLDLDLVRTGTRVSLCSELLPYILSLLAAVVVYNIWRID